MTRISSRKWLCLVFIIYPLLSFLFGWYLKTKISGNMSDCNKPHPYIDTKIHTSNSLTIPNRGNNAALILDTPGCKIPKLDPYDPSIKKLISTQAPYVCPGKPLFIYTHPNGSLNINETILQTFYKIKTRDVSCSYQSIRRKYEKRGNYRENDYVIGNRAALVFGKPLGEDHAIVECVLDKENLTQYIPIPRLIKELEDKRASRTHFIPHLNVIAIGIDSVSKLNFIRHFHKTKRFLQEKISHFEMNGYTKVGDNTFPNLLPLLAGRFPEDVWNETLKNEMFFDNVDFVWKKYANKGYRTFFTEDMPVYGTFNLNKRGFHDQPTDYYFRPLSLAINQSPLKKRSKLYCLNSQTETDIMYDYLLDFIRTMGPRPYFAFLMTSSLSHNYLNHAGYADEPASRLLGNLKNMGALNNSALVFFSDHGIRFGSIRQTYIGKFEERLPFLYLYFPQWFLNHYPHFATNLRNNQNRLVTLFDVHATLLHLLEPYKESPSGREEGSTTPYGTSLIREVSPYRNCEEAHIMAPWCVCQEFHPKSVNSSVVVKSAAAIVKFINSKLKPYCSVCSALDVDEVKYAESGQINDLVLRFQKHENIVVNRYVVYGKGIITYADYIIRLTTKPNGGYYEGTVRYNTQKNVYDVLYIKVISWSDENSLCVRDQDIKMFCYCISENMITHI